MNNGCVLDCTFQQGHTCTWVCIHGEPCTCIVGPYTCYTPFCIPFSVFGLQGGHKCFVAVGAC